MISKINKIDKFGIFCNFKSDDKLDAFKKMNIIYGYNGSGKSTFANFFRFIKNSEENHDIKYQITIDNKIHNQGDDIHHNIHVFDTKYIENNLHFKDGKAESIQLIVGEDMGNLAAEIEKKEILLGELKKKAENSQKEIKQKEKEHGEVFTNIAKTIFAAIRGSASRTYHKIHAETDFNNLQIPIQFSGNDLSELVSKLQQNTLERIKINEEKFDFDSLLENSQTVLNKTIEAIIIEELKRNNALSNWVEGGVKIHSLDNFDDQVSCKFCLQSIPPSRIRDLLTHFNDADANLKKEIDILIEEINRGTNDITNLCFSDTARLYKEMQVGYGEIIDETNKEKEKLLSALKSLIIQLDNKKNVTSERMTYTEYFKADVFNNLIGKANAIIDKHNKQTDDFDIIKSHAEAQIKNHYLSTIQKQVANLKNEIDSLKNEIGTQQVEILKTQESIREGKNKISVTHVGCDALNEKIANFLGRDEIKLLVLSEGGYTITRNNEPAKSLSEGEKTAIALMHFITSLNDINERRKSDILVIDDPVSSLDSNSLFQAHAFIKDAILGAQQVFILTHNFNFLKLLLSLNDEYKRNGGLQAYMLENKISKNKRSAFVKNLDNLLTKYDTEYQYLFQLLYRYNENEDQDIKASYNIPNIARKFLEYFLAYYMPNNKKLKEKMKAIAYDNIKKDFIINLINKKSHYNGSDFSEAFSSETLKAVKETLNLVKVLAPEQYETLKGLIN